MPSLMSGLPENLVVVVSCFVVSFLCLRIVSTRRSGGIPYEFWGSGVVIIALALGLSSERFFTFIP